MNYILRKYYVSTAFCIGWIKLISPLCCVAQDIKVIGITPAYLQTTPLDHKLDWNLFLGTTFNPVDLKFDSVRYPASDIRLQIGNSLSYKVRSNLLITAGVLYQRNFPFDSRFTNEFRLYQQLSGSHRLSGIKINHRLRFSERFIQNKTAASYPLTTMLQYLTGFTIPLKSKRSGSKNFYITGYTEEYITLSGANKYQTFSEFWAYLGIGYNLMKWGRLQNGIVYEWVIRNSKKNVRRLCYLEIFWITGFDIFKKNRT